MEHLTTGMINQSFVGQFLKCLYECDGDIKQSLLLADDKHNINAVSSTEESDSWHEALAQFRSTHI